MTCRYRSEQRHTARRPGFEVRICYPFHPRNGETVAVLGSKCHAGAEHFIIRQPDRTLTLLPAWMTEPGQAATALVMHPRFLIERLAELRLLLDARMASCTGPTMRSARRKQGELFEEGRVTELASPLVVEFSGRPAV